MTLPECLTIAEIFTTTVFSVKVMHDCICKFLTINKSIFHPYLYFSFPFIGHLYKFGNKPIECLDECQKNFGDIFRLDTATGPTVWLCNYKQITEAMKSDTFAGRPYHKLPGLPSCRDEKCQ